MENQKRTKKPVIIVMILLLIIAAAVVAAIVICSKKAGAAPLSEYWSADSKPAQRLREYVAKVTDPKDKTNFIPEKDRIAVFDMDGTLACETFYTYYDTMMFIEYCLHDHPERVSDELKAVAASIKPGYVADETLARNFAKAYAGMTVEEFYNYAVEFGKKQTASFNNMRYIDNFYLPMVELVKYLYENGFTIYVISGTERTTTRAIVANSPIKDFVTPNHVIGTDFEVKQKGHEDEPSNMNFKYEDGDDLVITGGFIQKNLNGNKSIYVEREIGQRPVLAFGNSGSDSSMMKYTIDARNPYPAEAYMIVADDNEREWGTQDWEAKSADYIAKGFIPISMKQDFARIYADGITKAAEQYHETESETFAAPDYSVKDNWAYFEKGEDKEVDVFLICPTVDTKSETNAFDLNDKLKGNFIYALDLEKGIYEDTGRLFSPYYRQMSINAYKLPEAEREKAKAFAYQDVSAAFRWYLDHENDGRGIILAGFSQGSEMCLELLKEYYGGDGEEAQALRDKLIAVYAIGWSVTEEMTKDYPQIVPAAGETDIGTVISFDCEDGNVTETIIIPAGMKALSINPLNWKTDGTAADRSLNHGAVMQAGAEPVPALCGAHIGSRGELIVTDVSAAEYPPVLDIFPEGAYHLYDYMFFFTNLKENVAARTATWQAAQESDLVLSDDASGFVLLSEAVPDVILEIRYYSTYNFVGERIDGYEEPLAMLTAEAAAALKEASDELMEKGYRLKIFDAYRPQTAVTHFMNWALDPDDTRMKEYFYPELDKTVLFPQGYIAEHSGHSRGSTVDLTLFDMETEQEVDMGGTFDYFGELSHPDYTEITQEQYAMRMLLREVMVKHGFRPLAEEWWHFTFEDEPYPNTYFTFPINSDSLDDAA
ncbi:MAG: DUF3089 domain-containing protein [Lachnospiraceae bacterium]|nr:DUF3089 domain-containing protein [Lachnospiraceae bacterium]